MKLFDKLNDKITHYFHPPLKEIVAQEIQKEMAERNGFKHRIKVTKFQLHMTQAKIDALIEWDKKEKENAD
ncbi:hypothetical protein Tiera_041 [Polaromonas phage Tiera]|nr:hypothetical protein Tiera_041 [Polaromonas phage Tiera]